ncbi:MAG: hypothetical protein LBQ52_00685 [Helicobacteraceae bacterium]|nr:hypothetical protein [Helicobacteraceae bacterium]
MKARHIFLTAFLSFLTYGCSQPNAYLIPEPSFFESRATIEGIDSDGDGVRDDVWNYIAKLYPKPEDEPFRQALAQRAKMFQKAIIIGSQADVKSAFALVNELERSRECIWLKFFNGVHPNVWTRGGAFSPRYEKLEDKAVNTDARRAAYKSYRLMTSTTSSDKEYEIPCEYDEKRERELAAAFGDKTLEEINPNLPPDPDEEGKKTLEGIDSDKDGVRDDVQRIIWKYAPRPDQEKLRLALFQRARAWQQILTLDTSDRNAVLEARENHFRASECLDLKSIRGDLEESRLIRDVMINTADRKRAHSAYYTTLDKNGINDIGSSNDITPCDFDNSTR